MDVQDLFSSQRTARGKRYEDIRERYKLRYSTDKEFRAKLDRSLFALPKRAEPTLERMESELERRGVAASSVHSNEFLQKLSLQYANDEYIGERLMPVVSVSKFSDAFPTYPKRERLAFPDDEMVDGGDPNELNETRGSDSYSLKPYALKNSVDAQTVANQDPAFDEMFDLVESLVEGLALKREQRIATVLTTTGNYSGNTATLSGADQWDSASGGNPVKNLLEWRSSCWSGRGPGAFWGFCGRDVWNVLARHPLILDLFKFTAPGIATPALVAGYFGLAGILVGDARQDGANLGQTASYSRIWGKYFGIVRVASSVSLRNVAFGYTLRFRGHPVTTQWVDPTKGIDTGAYYAKVGAREQHKVMAGDAGFLGATVIA